MSFEFSVAADNCNYFCLLSELDFFENNRFLSMDVAQLQTKLREYKQEHLLQFWDTLTEEEQHEFYQQLNK